MLTSPTGPDAHRPVNHAASALQDTLRTAADNAPGVGQGIEVAWHDLSQEVRQAAELPVIKSVVSEGTLTDVVTHGAQAVGLAAAGISLEEGAVKLIKPGDASQKLQGGFDVVTGGAVATTLLGSQAASLVMAPVAAACGVIGGVLAVVHGAQKGDAREAAQGALNGSRAVAVACSRLGEVASPLAVAASVVSGVAAGVQMVRGCIELDQAVKAHKLSGEVDGLSDVGVSAGLMLAATGIGIIPGIALLAVAGATPLLYSWCKPFHAWADRELEAHQSGLQGLMARAEALAQPVVSRVEAAVAKMHTP